MNSNDSADGKSVLRLIIVFSFFSSAFGLFLLYKLDYLVHGDLYNYGLQFSYNWILPMWTFERLLGFCFILPVVFGAGALVWDFRRSRKCKLVVKHVKPVEQKPQVAPLQVNNNGVKAQALRENSMVISCPSCKKMFGKPLVMLDFSGKEARLVNVCPYCNRILGNAKEKVDKDDIDVGALDYEKRMNKSER